MKQVASLMARLADHSLVRGIPISPRACADRKLAQPTGVVSTKAEPLRRHTANVRPSVCVCLAARCVEVPSREFDEPLTDCGWLNEPASLNRSFTGDGDIDMVPVDVSKVLSTQCLHGPSNIAPHLGFDPIR